MPGLERPGIFVLIKFCRLKNVRVYALYVRSTETLVSPFDFILDGFSVTKPLVPAEAGDVVAMDEDVLAAVIRLNKSEALLDAEPFHFSAWHNS